MMGHTEGEPGVWMDVNLCDVGLVVITQAVDLQRLSRTKTLISPESENTLFN